MKQIIFIMLFLFLCGVCYAAPSNSISIPNSFSPNTPIQSSQVNADFSECQTKYNAHSHTDITSVGAITTGTWAANVIDVAYGGTGLATIQPYELLYGSATGVISRLSPGTNGQYLKTQGTLNVPAWATISFGYDQIAWVTAKGDGSAIDDSYQCTSVTDDGTGIITANWSITFASVNYCALTSVLFNANGFIRVSTKAVGSTQATHRDAAGAAADPTQYHILAFGD